MTSAVDLILNNYVDTVGEKASTELLAVMADRSSGGRGYLLATPAILDFDGHDVLHGANEIRLDSANFGFSRSTHSMVEDL